MKIMGNSLALPRRLLETELILTPLADQGNQTSNPSYVGARNFDANMVVILAALLCALIGALGINSIVRCFLRCSHRFNIESPEQAAARLAGTGLKKRDLGQIPIGVYGGDLSIKGTECAICLGEFEDGDKVRMLPICKHGFHVRCIDAWLLSHSSCPNCRHSLLARPNVLKEAAVVEPSPPPPGAASSHQGSVVLVIQTSDC